MSGPLTDFPAVERRVSQAVRSRVYRDKVPSEVEIPPESRLTTVIQHSNRVRVSLSTPRRSDHNEQHPRGAAAAVPSPVFMRKTSRSYARGRCL